MTSFLAVVLLIDGVMAHAKPVEVWQCRDFVASDWKSILVTATVDSGREYGKIAAAGVTQAAVFHVEGFNRRWDFGVQSNGSYRYSFIIQPNGDAAYYDFGEGGTGRPSNMMKCRQVDATAAPN
jgi:hypothetical protein